jgi:hypothetical protein
VTLPPSLRVLALAEHRVVVIGGYGFFGGRLVERLRLQPDIHITVAGRSLIDAQGWVEKLRRQRPLGGERLEAAALDALSAALPQDLAQLRPDTVVLASGPFQDQDYRVARACIAIGANYIDLSDARAFVTGIGALDEAAKSAYVFVTSGASSVPALSSAVVDTLVQGMSNVSTIDIGISPGNRTERGLSTMKAILSYCGKPIPGQGPSQTIGWLGSRRHRYPPPVGLRWLSPCDVPDLSLLPQRYAGAPEVRFGAGLELTFMHFGMNAMARVARRGLVRDWSAHAGWLKHVADRFKGWGSDAGGMHVAVTGRRSDGAIAMRTWSLIATEGDGPYVPTLAATALIRKLAAGHVLNPGAKPCVGSLSLADFELEAQGLRISMAESVK